MMHGDRVVQRTEDTCHQDDKQCKESAGGDLLSGSLPIILYGGGLEFFRFCVFLAAKQTADARKTCDEMLTKYSEERLMGSSEDGFDENISKLFQSVKAALEQAEQAQDAEPNDTEE